jgi:hypothetical protein
MSRITRRGDRINREEAIHMLASLEESGLRDLASQCEIPINVKGGPPQVAASIIDYASSQSKNQIDVPSLLDKVLQQAARIHRLNGTIPTTAIPKPTGRRENRMTDDEPRGGETRNRKGMAVNNPIQLPLQVLNAARQAVPAVDYALGVAGISAATAIVVFFVGRTQASIILVALVFIGMLLLFTFSRLAVAQDPPIRLAGVVLLWGVLVFFLLFLGFTATAFLFRAPSAWADFLGIPTLRVIP